VRELQQVIEKAKEVKKTNIADKQSVVKLHMKPVSSPAK